MSKNLGSSLSNSTVQSAMEDVIAQGSLQPTWKEHFKACCKPIYQLRKLKNKGAIVVLIHTIISHSSCMPTYQDTS